MANLVPIVWGPHKKDIENMAPKGSYIHTEDWPTEDDVGNKKLINYLNHLNDNDTAYMEYHAWRTNGMYPIDVSKPTETHTKKRVCGACRLIRKKISENYPIRMIKSFTSWWWMNTHDDKCTNGTEWVPEYLKKIDPPVSMEDNWWDEIRRGG